MLEVALRKKLGAFEIEADFFAGEPGFSVLFGKSGAGKTSVVKMLAGLLAPSSGRIVFEGDIFFDAGAKINLPPERRGVGYVFQEHRLFPHLSVKRNLTFGRFPGRRKSSVPMDKVVELLGISHLLNRGVRSLSGGESQRVALGRALLGCTSFLIMDEPLSSLDAERKEELLGYIAKVPEEFGFHTIYITHDPSEVAGLADRIILMENGGAKVCATPPAEFVSRHCALLA